VAGEFDSVPDNADGNRAVLMGFEHATGVTCADFLLRSR